MIVRYPSSCLRGGKRGRVGVVGRSFWSRRCCRQGPPGRTGCHPRKSIRACKCVSNRVWWLHRAVSCALVKLVRRGERTRRLGNRCALRWWRTQKRSSKGRVTWRREGNKKIAAQPVRPSAGMHPHSTTPTPCRWSNRGAGRFQRPVVQRNSSAFSPMVWCVGSTCGATQLRCVDVLPRWPGCIVGSVSNLQTPSCFVPSG